MSRAKKQSDKIKMLVVIKWPVGGIRTFCRYVYNHFDRCRFQFTILAPEVDELKALANDLKLYDINWISTSYKGDTAYLSFLTIAKTIALGDFDIIHSHGLSAGVYCSLPAKVAGIPHLMTSHDVFTQKQLSGLSGVTKKVLISSALLLIDTIHHVSKDAKENMHHHLPVLKRFESRNFLSRNGIRVSQFQNAGRRDFHAEYALNSATFLIGFMGRFMAQKGFRYLVDAVEILSKKTRINTPFKVLCFGWGGFIREEQGAIREKGLEEYFLFLPFTADVAASLRGLDVLAMPSLWEACPLLPMEAMVAGVPIIGTDCVGLREVLMDNEVSARKIPMRDGEALAEAIARESESPRREQAGMYVERAVKLFDVRHQAAAIQNRLLELTGNCRHGKKIQQKSATVV